MWCYPHRATSIIRALHLSHLSHINHALKHATSPRVTWEVAVALPSLERVHSISYERCPRSLTTFVVRHEATMLSGGMRQYPILGQTRYALYSIFTTLRVAQVLDLERTGSMALRPNAGTGLCGHIASMPAIQSHQHSRRATVRCTSASIW